MGNGFRETLQFYLVDCKTALVLEGINRVTNLKNWRKIQKHNQKDGY